MTTNRFPGVCTVCGKSCPAGKGVAKKSDSDGKWRVQHIDCNAAPATKAATAFAPSRPKQHRRRNFVGLNPWQDDEEAQLASLVSSQEQP